ncbi:unnamed protein product, partial [Nesidiocoris tenuis]
MANDHDIELAVIKRRLNDVKTKNKSLKEELKMCSRKAETAEALEIEVASAHRTIGQLKEDLAKTKISLTEAKNGMYSLSVENEGLKKEIAALRSRLHSEEQLLFQIEQLRADKQQILETYSDNAASAIPNFVELDAENVELTPDGRCCIPDKIGEAGGHVSIDEELTAIKSNFLTAQDKNTMCDIPQLVNKHTQTLPSDNRSVGTHAFCYEPIQDMKHLLLGAVISMATSGVSVPYPIPLNTVDMPIPMSDIVPPHCRRLRNIVPGTSQWSPNRGIPGLPTSMAQGPTGERPRPFIESPGPTALYDKTIYWPDSFSMKYEFVRQNAPTYNPKGDRFALRSGNTLLKMSPRTIREPSSPRSSGIIRFSAKWLYIHKKLTFPRCQSLLQRGRSFSTPSDGGVTIFHPQWNMVQTKAPCSSECRENPPGWNLCCQSHCISSDLLRTLEVSLAPTGFAHCAMRKTLTLYCSAGKAPGRGFSSHIHLRHRYQWICTSRILCTDANKFTTTRTHGGPLERSAPLSCSRSLHLRNVLRTPADDNHSYFNAECAPFFGRLQTSKRKIRPHERMRIVIEIVYFPWPFLIRMMEIHFSSRYYGIVKMNYVFLRLNEYVEFEKVLHFKLSKRVRIVGIILFKWSLCLVLGKVFTRLGLKPTYGIPSHAVAQLPLAQTLRDEASSSITMWRVNCRSRSGLFALDPLPSRKGTKRKYWNLPKIGNQIGGAFLSIILIRSTVQAKLIFINHPTHPQRGIKTTDFVVTGKINNFESCSVPSRQVRFMARIGPPA